MEECSAPSDVPEKQVRERTELEKTTQDNILKDLQAVVDIENRLALELQLVQVGE